MRRPPACALKKRDGYFTLLMFMVIIPIEADTKSNFTITHNCIFKTTYSKSQGGIVGKVEGVGHEGINAKLTAEFLLKIIECDGMTNYSDDGHIEVSNEKSLKY